MITLKLTKREADDLEFALDLATLDLDDKYDMADNDNDRFACEATSQRLAVLYRRLQSAAQKEAG